MAKSSIKILRDTIIISRPLSRRGIKDKNIPDYKCHEPTRVRLVPRGESPNLPCRPEIKTQESTFTSRSHIPTQNECMHGTLNLTHLDIKSPEARLIKHQLNT